jgi:hypothetical protein
VSLFNIEPEPRPLTDRQARIFQIIVHAGADGITADELGAHLHAGQKRHGSGYRCAFCATDGRRALGEKAISERVTKRGRSTYLANGVSAPSAQLADLAGETFEDIFGDAA